MKRNLRGVDMKFLLAAIKLALDYAQEVSRSTQKSKSAAWVVILFAGEDVRLQGMLKSRFIIRVH